MNRIGKKWLTASLAAALIIGGGAVALRTTAYADNTTNTSAVSGTAADGFAAKGDHGKWRGFKEGAERWDGRNVLKETATLLGTDEKTIVTELQAGKTLAQVAKDKAGWDEQTLLDKLSAAITAKLDEQVKSGKMTQAKADEAKSKLADSLKKAVEQTGLPFEGRGRGHGGRFGEFGQMKDIASMLNLSETDLKAKLQAGQSLADVAKAQGIAEDDLIAKIKDGMTNRIKQFVERVHKAPAADSTAPVASQAPAASAQ